MAGKVIFQTGSFLGEMGTTAGGQLFVNSFGQSKGIKFDGVESISASADGDLIKTKFNKTTGNVIEVKVKEVSTGKTFRRSGSAANTSNQIEFQQNAAGAFISVSGSDPGFNIIETDAGSFSRYRSNFIDFISQSAYSVGVAGNVFQIANSISNAGDKILRIDNSKNVGLSGSVSITGSLLVNGSAVGSGGGAIATYNSSGDNRVITSVDSDTVQGEENLTFDGSTLNVNGTLSATRKSFDIQHPSKPDKRLVYGSLEGPEFGVYIRGKVEGDNKIEMPDYWVDLVDMNTLSVHLTPINSEKAIYFTFSDNKYIYINREAHFFYMICAERKDIDRLQVEQ